MFHERGEEELHVKLRVLQSSLTTTIIFPHDSSPMVFLLTAYGQLILNLASIRLPGGHDHVVAGVLAADDGWPGTCREQQIYF